MFCHRAHGSKSLWIRIPRPHGSMQDGARGGTYTSHNHIEIASRGVRGVRGADPGRPGPSLGECNGVRTTSSRTIHFRKMKRPRSGRPPSMRPARSVKAPYLRLHLLRGHLNVFRGILTEFFLPHLLCEPLQAWDNQFDNFILERLALLLIIV